MRDWTETVRRNHRRAQRALVDQVNQMSVSVPIGSGDYDAPGYLHIGHFYSCVPDPAYPWDANVLAAIREIVPDAMPLVIRSVWRWSNYAEHGHIDDEYVLVHHGIGRAIRDPFHALHDFYCEMPSAPIPGLQIPGRDLADCRPNYIETYWQHATDKPDGFDLPGRYVAFDWRLYHQYAKAEADRQRALAASRASVDSEGQVIAKGAADATIKEERRDVAAAATHARDDQESERRELDKFYNIVPSDVEMKELLLGTGRG